MPLVRYGGVWVDPLPNIRSGTKWQQRASMDTGVSRWSWQYINGSLTIINDESKKALQYSNTGGASAAAHIAWAGAGDVVDSIVYARIKTVAAGSNNRVYGVIARGGGTAANKRGYLLRYINGEVDIARYNGSSVSPGLVHPTLPLKVTLVNTQGNYLRFKFRCVGNEQLGKAWLEGTAEPDWLVGSSAGAFTTAGHCGLFVGAGVDTYAASAFQVAPL